MRLWLAWQASSVWELAYTTRRDGCIRRSDRTSYHTGMHLTIELVREVDGRWIADIPELNVLLYTESKDEAIRKAEAAAREIIADRIAHGELPVEAANPEFAVAA